jgi:hypothetical protein
MLAVRVAAFVVSAGMAGGAGVYLVGDTTALHLPTARRPAPLSATCARLPVGIRAQESGGNYRAVNVHTGALGAYQVLPGNVAPWSRDVLGYPVTPARFLASAPVQDRVAKAKLAALCRRYGPRGSAAAWFSGHPELANDTTPRGGGAASVKAYVDSVMAHARAGH